jgi:hypothetical protein
MTGQPSLEDDMGNPTDDGDLLRGLELEVEAELKLAESSRPEEVMGLPSAEWPFDPMDVQREEIGLRNLLGAVEATEGHDHRDDERAAGS